MVFGDLKEKNSKIFELKSVGEGGSIIQSKTVDYLGIIRNKLNYMKIL